MSPHSENAGPEAESEADRLARANQLRREVGFPELAFSDEVGPEVELALVEALARDELVGDVQREVFLLTERYAAWNRAFVAALLREARREQERRL